MKRYFVLFLFILIALGITTARSLSSPTEMSPDCATCHQCEKPTVEVPCLLACPRQTTLTIHDSVGEIPEVVILAELSSRYVPVLFAHRLHASMSELGGGCVICHHHQTEREISPCRDCHQLSLKTADLSRPSLKGAYHRQCLGCHREWSHTTACAICHALKSRDDESRMAADKSDIVGIDHPPIAAPTRVVYETDPDVGAYVTFYHDDHVERFDLSCSSCHQKESCGRCHDTAAGTRPSRPPSASEEDRDFDTVHNACLACHESSGCDKCHQESERHPFNHAVSARWPLGPNHANVPCRECHGADFSFVKPDRRCDGCHAGWDLGAFDHGVAGLSLDDTHVEMDCDLCHVDRDFSREPGCDNCHDDRDHPRDTPGTVVDSQKSR